MSKTPEIISWSQAHSCGLKCYYTGQLCAHGHRAERYVSSDGCVECTRARVRKWKAENPKEHAEIRRRYNRKRYQLLKKDTKRWGEECDRQHKKRLENRALILAARLILQRGIE